MHKNSVNYKVFTTLNHTDVASYPIWIQYFRITLGFLVFLFTGTHFNTNLLCTNCYVDGKLCSCLQGYESKAKARGGQSGRGLVQQHLRRHRARQASIGAAKAAAKAVAREVAKSGQSQTTGRDSSPWGSSERSSPSLCPGRWAPEPGRSLTCLPAEGVHADVCPLIMALVKNKNPANSFGDTPLHQAAKRGHADVSQLIMEEVENKNPENSIGETTMNIAACLRI